MLIAAAALFVANYLGTRLPADTATEGWILICNQFNLAGLYTQQQQHTQAESLYLQALKQIQPYRRSHSHQPPSADSSLKEQIIHPTDIERFVRSIEKNLSVTRSQKARSQKAKPDNNQR